MHSTPEHSFNVEAEAGAVLPVQRRRARQGRRGAARAEPDDRHHPGAVTTDRSAAVLAHGLGGSTDLPIPFTYALIGAAWALTFTFAVVALAWRRPRFDPEKPGRPLPPLGDRRWSTRRPTRWARRDGGAAVRGLGGGRRVLRAAERARTRCPGSSTCCCGSAWWPCRWPSDRCGGRSPRCAPCTDCCGRRSLRSALSRSAGYWPAARWPVRVRLARAGQSGPGIAWRDQDLAAGLSGRDVGRRIVLR